MTAAALASVLAARTAAPSDDGTTTIWLPSVDATQFLTPGSVVMSAPGTEPERVVVAAPLPHERFADRAARAERELRAGSGSSLRGRVGGLRPVAVWDPRRRVVQPDDAAALTMLARWLGADCPSALELRRELRASRRHAEADPVVTPLPARRRGEPCR